MPLQVRRGPTADRLLITPVEGELILDTTENTLYVGDGSTPGGVAASTFSFEDAQDAAAALFTSGIHPNITFTYNDQANRIDTTLNLRNYSGVIEADAFQGSLFSDNSTLLVDGILGSINLDGTIRSDLIPVANEVYDIGSPTSKFKDLYLSGSSLFLGDAQVTAVGTAVNLPAGSTIDGVAIGTGNGNGEIIGDGVVQGSNYRINIIGDDSSIILNSSTASITAPGGITGPLRGAVIGEDSTVIIDPINNEIFGQFNGSLSGTLDTAGFPFVSDSNMFLAPQGFTQFGAVDAAINGNLVIRRVAYSGGLLDGLGGILFDHYHDDFRTDKLIAFHRSRGTRGTPLPLQADDQIAELTFIGNTNQAPFSGISSSIRVVVDSAPVLNITPSRIEFRCFSTSTDPDPRVMSLTPDKRLLVDRIESLRSSLTIVGDLNGSVFSDDSTRIIDGTDGSITAGSFVQFGSLTATERNALTAVNGMVIYNTTYNRFEGYQNGAWINLDDGTAAGV
jgi:hypothetical protein